LITAIRFYQSKNICNILRETKNVKKLKLINMVLSKQELAEVSKFSDQDLVNELSRRAGSYDDVKALLAK
jgi:hypothetical protein